MLYIKEQDLDRMLQEQFLNGMEAMKQRMLQACENGNPINIEGRAWFLKSDIQNLRDIFDDLVSEAKGEPVMYSFGVLKQLLFDCAANLMLTDKPRKEVADDLLKHLAELDKFKIDGGIR